MPYCPPCRLEYEEGVETCTDCAEVLVAGPMPEEVPERAGAEEKWTVLMRVRDDETAEIVRGLLMSGGIECQIVGKAFVEMPVPVVDSLSRIEICVPQARAEEARAILNETREGTAPCPSCGHMSSADAPSCEYCGAPPR
ncbi:MAG TPA: DUF2007 domain-containing protein [Candidatus Polarisedimenticolia bacterium]|jgi:hypothetical protein